MRAPGREVPFITIKRSNPRWGELYGHWWIELDRRESYGWWPARPLLVRHWLTGTAGVLNGQGLHRRASATRDMLHRSSAEHRFHPVLLEAKTDDQLRVDIRRFAQSYSGRWAWTWPWSVRAGQNCRTFQLELMAAVGLAEPNGALSSHGPGCPVLYPARRVGWAAWDRTVRAGKVLGAASSRAWVGKTRLLGRGHGHGSLPDERGSSREGVAPQGGPTKPGS